MNAGQPNPIFFLLRTPAGEPEGPLTLAQMREIYRRPGGTGVELACVQGEEKWDTLLEALLRWSHIPAAEAVSVVKAAQVTALDRLRKRSAYEGTRAVVWTLTWLGLIVCWIAVLSLGRPELLVMAIVTTVVGLLGAQILTILIDIADAQLAQVEQRRNQANDDPEK